jgi:hypothetical protein
MRLCISTRNVAQVWRSDCGCGTVGDADIVLIRSKTKATKEYIDQAAKMKMIIRGGVGLDNVDVPYCKEKGIVVKNTPEASSIAVAELAFAMMIAVPNRLVEAHNSMKEGKWLKKELKRTELYGKTLGPSAAVVSASDCQAGSCLQNEGDWLRSGGDQVRLYRFEAVAGCDAAVV